MARVVGKVLTATKIYFDSTYFNPTLGGGTVEGADVLSTGEAGGTKFLREDGDGTCSWQTPTGAPHTQNTDTDLGALSTKNPPIDADKAIYRDSTATDALVTSTWTQIKAFLKTYFDGVYAAVLGADDNYVTDAEKSALHTQNTDTGTTGNTFTVDSDSTTGKIIVDVALGAADLSLTLTNETLTASSKIATLQNKTGTIALTSDIPVISDVAYDVTSWDANTDAPSKNAVRDKIEALDSAKLNRAGGFMNGGLVFSTAYVSGDGTVTLGSTNHVIVLMTDGVVTGDVIIDFDGGWDSDGRDYIICAVDIDATYNVVLTTSTTIFELPNGTTTNTITLTDADNGKVFIFKAINTNVWKQTYPDLNIPTISNTAYDATTWDANLDGASKDAIRDQIEIMRDRVYYADTLTVDYGTLDTGTVANLAAVGGTDVNVSEASGANALQVQLDFPSVTQLDGFAFFGRYTGSSSHQIAIEVYNGTTWDTLGSIGSTTAKQWYSFNIYSPSTYIILGVVKVRFRHLQSGVITHDLVLDYCELNHGGGGAGGTALTASTVTFTPAGTVAATNVQEAIEEVVTDYKTFATAMSIVFSRGRVLV